MLETWIDFLSPLPRIQLRWTKVQENMQFPHWSAKIVHGILHFVASKSPKLIGWKGKAIITHQKKKQKMHHFSKKKSRASFWWVFIVLVGMCFFPSIFVEAAIPVVSYDCKAEIRSNESVGELDSKIFFGPKHRSSLWFYQEMISVKENSNTGVVCQLLWPYTPRRFHFCNNSPMFFDFGRGNPK